MIEDMNLAGLSLSTQKEYIRAVLQLVRRYRVSPDKLSEQQVTRYLKDLHKRVARGTFMVKYSGIKFLYCQTLGLDWNLFTKKKFANHDGNACHAL